MADEPGPSPNPGGTQEGDSPLVSSPTEALDGDSAIVQGIAAPSERVSLSRERIVDAAIGFIDEHGLASLSMRRLGALLSVEAMSLYRYVPGREQLLDAVVERMVGEMTDDPAVLDSPEHGWQDYLQRLAHGIRRVALAHPKHSRSSPLGRPTHRGSDRRCAA